MPPPRGATRRVHPCATASSMTRCWSRIRAQPRRTSTSGGLRCSRRSRVRRLQKVTSGCWRRHRAAPSTSCSAQAATISWAKMPSATKSAGAPEDDLVGAARAVAADVVDRCYRPARGRQVADRAHRGVGVPGPRVVPVDQSGVGSVVDHGQRGIVPAAVEVVEAEHREPGRGREPRLARSRGSGQHHDAGHDRTGEHRVIVPGRWTGRTKAPPNLWRRRRGSKVRPRVDPPFIPSRQLADRRSRGPDRDPRRHDDRGLSRPGARGPHPLRDARRVQLQDLARNVEVLRAAPRGRRTPVGRRRPVARDRAHPGPLHVDQARPAGESGAGGPRRGHHGRRDDPVVLRLRPAHSHRATSRTTGTSWPR